LIVNRIDRLSATAAAAPGAWENENRQRRPFFRLWLCPAALLVLFALAPRSAAAQGLGTAVFTVQTSCPTGTLILPNTNNVCYDVNIHSCPGGDPFVAWLKITEPTSGVIKGTILFTTGIGGAGWYDQGFNFGSMIVNAVVEAGYAAAQTSFKDYSGVVSEPSGWLTVLDGANEGPGNLACRYATLAQGFFTSSIYPGGSLEATGNSEGGALIAYALARYGLGSTPVLSLAEVTSGPTAGRLDYGCLCNQPPIFTSYGQGFLTECFLGDAISAVDPTYAATTAACSSAVRSHTQPQGINFYGDSVVNGAEAVSYPQTVVNVLFGGLDNSPGVANGLNWANPNVISAKSLTIAGIGDARHALADSVAAAFQVIADLTGSGSAPGVVLSPTGLTFPNQAVGTTSAPETLTLTNTGNATLTITSIQVTGTNSGDFAETNTCGTTVPAGGNCTINVTFTPMATGTRTAAVSITDNAVGSPQSAGLTGVGTGPVVSLSPSSVNFGDQVVGTVSPTEYITLTNTGNAPLTISSITLLGAAFLMKSKCGGTLAAGANCVIDVAFKPSSTGTLTGTVTITDNAPGSPQTVPLTGQGTLVAFTPTSLSFGTVKVGNTSAPQNVTLTNDGTSKALSITSIGFSGADPGDFAQTNNCGSSVPAKGSCTITVTFKPTATGVRSASLSVADNGGGSPQTVPVSGTGQ
jgi:hypothetical protein